LKRAALTIGATGSSTDELGAKSIRTRLGADTATVDGSSCFSVLLSAFLRSETSLNPVLCMGGRKREIRKHKRSRKEKGGAKEEVHRSYCALECCRM
jgi:hypothetical protein